jgi:hypothetical protein
VSVREFSRTTLVIDVYEACVWAPSVTSFNRALGGHLNAMGTAHLSNTEADFIAR